MSFYSFFHFLIVLLLLFFIFSLKNIFCLFLCFFLIFFSFLHFFRDLFFGSLKSVTAVTKCLSLHHMCHMLTAVSGPNHQVIHSRDTAHVPPHARFGSPWHLSWWSMKLIFKELHQQFPILKTNRLLGRCCMLVATLANNNISQTSHVDQVQAKANQGLGGKNHVARCRQQFRHICLG